MKDVAVDATAFLEGLGRLERRLFSAIDVAGRKAVADTEKAAKGTVLWKDKSTDTRKSVKGKWGGVNAGGFVLAQGVSKFLEYGTRPHRIEARNGRALRFVVGGQVIFRRWVSHPGTKPRPFMREARSIGEVAVRHHMQIELSAAIQNTR